MIKTREAWYRRTASIARHLSIAAALFLWMAFPAAADTYLRDPYVQLFVIGNASPDMIHYQVNLSGRWESVSLPAGLVAFHTQPHTGSGRDPMVAVRFAQALRTHRRYTRDNCRALGCNEFNKRSFQWGEMQTKRIFGRVVRSADIVLEMVRDDRPYPYVDKRKFQQLQADPARRAPPSFFIDTGLRTNNVTSGARPELLSIDLVPERRVREFWSQLRSHVERKLQEVRRSHGGGPPPIGSWDASLWNDLIAVNQRYGLGLASETASDHDNRHRLVGVWSCTAGTGTLNIEPSLSGNYTWNPQFGGGTIKKEGAERGPDSLGNEVDWTIFSWSEPRRPPPKNSGWWRVTYKENTDALHAYWGFKGDPQRRGDGKPAGGSFSCRRTR